MPVLHSHIQHRGPLMQEETPPFCGNDNASRRAGTKRCLAPEFSAWSARHQRRYARRPDRLVARARTDRAAAQDAVALSGRRDRRDRALGLLQQEPQAAGGGAVGRLRHHRDAHASRQRRRRAHGQGRSRRRERFLLGQDAQGREPARRRTDGCIAVRARRRRRSGRAHLHRTGGGRRCRGRRCARGAHPRRASRARARIRSTRARASAATPPHGGAFTTTT